jgi:imidazolonepropionase-like amidohydrolase
VAPFVALRDKKLRALVSVGQSSDWMHWLDAIGEREFEWSLRVPMTRELDLYEIAEAIGKRACRVVLEPELTLHPGTMRQRNIPAELARAGAKIVLIPRNDTIRDHERWLANVGEIVAAGLDRAVALRAVTLEPAALLGLDASLGSLEKDKTANLLFLNGDPLEVGTRVQAVMLEGTFVFGEVSQ